MRPLPRLLALAVVTALPALAQAPSGGVLEGHVVDAESGEGLAGAHVFLSGTSRGAATDAEGRFRLDAVPAGRHEVVATMVGYAPATQPLQVGAGGHTLAFRLRPQTEELGGITVTFDRSAWLRQLDRFEAAFFGESENAAEAELLNPEVLAFEEDGLLLRARASAPLEVANRALGYHVAYTLTAFESRGAEASLRGHARFLPTEPTDDREAHRWARARERAYEGSLQHFVHALADGDFGRFRVYQANTRHRLSTSEARGQDALARVRRPGDLLRPVPGGTEGALWPDAPLLRVDYTGEREERAYLRQAPDGNRRPGDQVSWLQAPAGEARVDLRTGQGYDPYPLVVSGYWGWHERLPNWLPHDYRPALDAEPLDPRLDAALAAANAPDLPSSFSEPPEMEVVRALGQVEVEAEGLNAALAAAGFYDRQEAGWGHFVGPEEIEARQPRTMTDLLGRVPGLTMLREGDTQQPRGRSFLPSGRTNPAEAPPQTGSDGRFIENPRPTTPEGRVSAHGTQKAECRPSVVVDGALVRGFGQGDPTDDLGRQGDSAWALRLDGLVRADEVVGVEVYTSASTTPAQFGGLASPCGAIVIWTRHSAGRRR